MNCFVLRDHDPARAHGGVAAARFELFENQNLGARVMRFNGGRGTRTAEARDQNVGFFFPLEVRDGFLGDGVTAESRSGGRQKAFGKSASLHDWFLYFGVDLDKRGCQKFRVSWDNTCP